jgi:hypothetical protein
MSGEAKTPKVAREVAEAEFDRLCTLCRIETDTSALTAEEEKDWQTDIRGPIVREIMAGTVVVADDGRPTFTPLGSSKGYTFHAPTGATLMALETYPGGKNIANLIAAMTDMTHSDKGEFSRMGSRDVQAAMRLARLFLEDR